MGFQVTPCAIMASPLISTEKEGKEIQILLPCTAADNNQDAQGGNGFDLINSPSTSSLSLRSHPNNFLLSQCSSLTSLPSLALSFNGSFNIKPSGDAAAGTISAHCSCISTLRSLGDQVACTGSPADSFFFSASSSSAVSPSLNAWPKRGSDGFLGARALGSRKEGTVRALAVVGDKVFSAHDDLKVRVWARTRGVKKEMSCMGSGGGGDHQLVAALPTTWDCVARCMAPGAYVQVRRHHKKLWIQHADTISALAVDAKGGYLYSASWDRSVKVWRLCDFKCMESFKAHDDAINTLALSTDGFLYTGSADGKIKAWSRPRPSCSTSSTIRQLQQRHSLAATLESHRSAVNALVFSGDGALLYSGACDKAIVVWEREGSAQHASSAGALRGHRQAVLCLASCGITLCSGSADRTIRVWQRVTSSLHTCVSLLQGHTSPVKSLSLFTAADDTGSSCESLSLYSAALDHDIKVWELRLSSN